MTICLILGIPLTCYLIMRIVRRRKWNRLRNQRIWLQVNSELTRCIEAFKNNVKGQGVIHKTRTLGCTERPEVLLRLIIALPQYLEIARRILKASTEMK